MSQPAPIIVVSGLPRSGTSLMMKMLEAAGLELLVDDVRQADEDNPKGYYELEAVKQMKTGATDWLAGASGKAVKIVVPLLRHLPESYTYKVLFMRRAMPEVLASQKKMLERRGKETDAVSDEMLAKIFEKQLVGTQKWMRASSNIEVLEVAFTDLLAGSSQAFSSIAELLEMDLDLTAMQRVVDPQLYRQRAN